MGQILTKIIAAIRNVLAFHKQKILSIVLFALIFAVILFPFGDLSDLLTSKVAELTQNQVYLQADDLGITLAHGGGIKLTGVVVEANSLPAMNATSLVIAPAISAFLRGAKGVYAAAEGIFQGDVEVDYSEGEKSKSGERLQKITANADHLAVNVISNFLHQMNFDDLKLQGEMQLKTQLSVDPVFDEQPKGNLDAQLRNLIIPMRVADLGMGPLTFPEVKLKKLSLRGTLGEGKLAIDEMLLGDDKDLLSGKVKGDFAIRMRGGKGGAPMTPDMGGYNLSFDLTVKPELLERAKLFLLLVDSYKTQSPAGTRYAFRVSAPNLNTPPKFAPL